MADLQIVYVLSNPAMPGLVKIGYTSQVDANTRIGQLYTTGVPVPFKLEFACKVPNADEVEQALHVAFGPHRINPKREFFKIDPEQAIAILKLLHVEEATAEIAKQPTAVDPQSMAAAEQLSARRPNLNFEEMGIPVGSTLQSVHAPMAVVVISSRRVKLNGEEMSLTAATREVMNLDYSVAPGPHWMYKGKLLREIYNETYGDSE
ncbi:MAG: GIY-YIG nuclease family protein [Pseudomonadota bacterium]